VHALWGGDHRPALYDWQTWTVWPKNIKIESTAETDTYCHRTLDDASSWFHQIPLSCVLGLHFPLSFPAHYLLINHPIISSVSPVCPLAPFYLDCHVHCYFVKSCFTYKLSLARFLVLRWCFDLDSELVFEPLLPAPDLCLFAVCSWIALTCVLCLSLLPLLPWAFEFYDCFPLLAYLYQ